MEVAGNLRVSMGIICLDQFPHSGGFFLVRNIGLTLEEGRRSQVEDFAWVSQRGVIGHSHHLEGRQPSLPKPMELRLVDNRLYRLLGICEALIIPFVFTGFMGRFEVSYLIGLGQVKIVCLC